MFRLRPSRDPARPVRVRRARGERRAAPPRTSGARGRGAGEDGFTLVELMVVIVIIGLLATIVAFNVIPSGDRAKVEKAKVDISTIGGALDMYRLQIGSYPTTSQGLQALVAPPAGIDAARYQRGGYIKRLPDDPWGRPYLYAAPGTHGEADVWTQGADGRDGGEGTDADIGSWQ